MVRTLRPSWAAALASVQPNAAHDALVRLESGWPGEFLLVTQNVDDLHDRAGSRRLLHMHGELLSALCERCGALVHEASFELTDITTQIADAIASVRADEHARTCGECGAVLEV